MATSTRDNVAKELLESERAFVEHMSALVSVYIRPLRLWSEELKNSYGRGSMHPVLPDGFLVEIFANLEQLLVFNQHIVEQLADIHKGSKAFGAFFKKAAPFFKMYSSYVSNHKRALETLNNLLETRLDFKSFVRACELQDRCKGQNLCSYLIMPVQRIPRYQLLLKELLKHTPPQDKDYEDLTAAVAVISEVANSVNEDIRRQERRFKVVEVQEKFEAELVTASRIFVKEGELIKMCRKGPKRFLFVLFNDLLIYGQQKISGRCVLHRLLDLSDMWVVDSGEAERSFVIATKPKAFVVQCKDLPEKREWMDSFKACFSEIDKSVLYRQQKRDPKWTSIALWMVREGNMVRELYSLPDLGEKPRGIVALTQLRLVLDPQALQEGLGGGGAGLGARVRSFFNGAAGANGKVGVESPVPCEDVSQVNDDDGDNSTYSDANSDAPMSPPHQADLLGLNDIYPHQRPQSVTMESPIPGTVQGAPAEAPLRPLSSRQQQEQGSATPNGQPQYGLQDQALYQAEAGSQSPMDPRRFSTGAAPGAGDVSRPQSRASVDGRRGSVGPQAGRRPSLSTGLQQARAVADAPAIAMETQSVGSEYVAVIPVTEHGLGLFLKDENGEVVIGGFRAPRNGLGMNPSQKAGVRLGDVLVRVNGVMVTSVAQTIAALRESRMEQVIALTLRKTEGASLKKTQRSPHRTFRATGTRVLGGT